MNPFKQVNWKPDAKALRRFGKSLVIGFPIIAAIFLFLGRIGSGEWSPRVPLMIGIAGLVAGLTFVLLPAIARPFYLVWYAVSCTIGLVVSNVLLASLYYTLFTGIGILRRVSGRSPIRREIDTSVTTYWIDAGPQPSPRSYYTQS